MADVAGGRLPEPREKNCYVKWNERNSRAATNAYAAWETVNGERLLFTVGPLGVVICSAGDAPEVARRLRLWADLIDHQVARQP